MNSTIITNRQCRAARGLLHLKQRELAELARIPQLAVVRFEMQQGVVTERIMTAIAGALERAGVEFLDQEGVRMRQADQEGALDAMRGDLADEVLPAILGGGEAWDGVPTGAEL